VESACYSDLIRARGQRCITSGADPNLGNEQPMATSTAPIAILAIDAAPRTKPSNYPEPFVSRMSGREDRTLGDVFGLMNFGVNLTRLAPHAVSAPDMLTRSRTSSSTSCGKGQRSKQMTVRPSFRPEWVQASKRERAMAITY
jgi:hypothetical protein